MESICAGNWRGWYWISIILAVTGVTAEYAWQDLDVTGDPNCCWFNLFTKQQLCYGCVVQCNMGLNTCWQPWQLIRYWGFIKCSQLQVIWVHFKELARCCTNCVTLVCGIFTCRWSWLHLSLQIPQINLWFQMYGNGMFFFCFFFYIKIVGTSRYCS